MNKNKEFIEVLSNSYNEDFFRNPDKKMEKELNETGILVLQKMLSPDALAELKKEALKLKEKAYRTESVYNIYVKPEDKSFAEDSPRNKKFKTTKGCIADDQVPDNSILRKVYDAPLFREFICKLQGLDAVYPYADKLSSININYYDAGDNLEWHFDNSDFAITLLIQNCEKGGVYQYFPNIRYKANNEENYEELAKAINDGIKPLEATMEEGSLMIFRGNRSLHRVTKIQKGERILVTLNYNMKPGTPLSEKSRMTFFGRIN